MNGTFVITYHTTSFGKELSLNFKLDGRKGSKNLIAYANEVAKNAGADSFKIVKMKGGDWVVPVEDCPLHSVLKY